MKKSLWILCAMFALSVLPTSSMAKGFYGWGVLGLPQVSDAEQPAKKIFRSAIKKALQEKADEDFIPHPTRYEWLAVKTVGDISGVRDGLDTGLSLPVVITWRSFTYMYLYWCALVVPPSSELEWTPNVPFRVVGCTVFAGPRTFKGDLNAPLMDEFRGTYFELQKTSANFPIDVDTRWPERALGDPSFGPTETRDLVSGQVSSTRDVLEIEKLLKPF